MPAGDYGVMGTTTEHNGEHSTRHAIWRELRVKGQIDPEAEYCFLILQELHPAVNTADLLSGLSDLCYTHSNLTLFIDSRSKAPPRY
jgi:hypothetical protein